MYGYILPDIDSLDIRDFVFYKSVFCGICKSIGKRLGTVARLSTGYDMTFLCIVVANHINLPFEFEDCRCIASIKRHTIAMESTLVDKIADLSVILGYYKIADNIRDSGGAKDRLAKAVFAKAYDRAKTNSKELDVIVSKYIGKLNELENANTVGIDRVSDCFANLAKEVAQSLSGKTDDNFDKMCYNIGKYIYLIDALDDIDEDAISNEYNPFLGLEVDSIVNSNKNKIKKFDRQQFFAKHKQEIQFCMYTTIGKIIECFDKTDFVGSYDLLKNIIQLGLYKKLKQVLNSPTKLKKYQAERDIKYPKRQIKAYNRQRRRARAANLQL